jgi:hypothetical protein
MVAMTTAPSAMRTSPAWANTGSSVARSPAGRTRPEHLRGPEARDVLDQALLGKGLAEIGVRYLPALNALRQYLEAQP